MPYKAGEDSVAIEHDLTGDSLLLATSIKLGTCVLVVGGPNEGPCSSIRLEKYEMVRLAEDILRLARRCG